MSLSKAQRARAIRKAKELCPLLTKVALSMIGLSDSGRRMLVALENLDRMLRRAA